MPKNDQANRGGQQPDPQRQQPRSSEKQAQPERNAPQPRYDDRPEPSSSAGGGKSDREPQRNPSLPSYGDQPETGTKGNTQRAPSYGDDESNDPRHADVQADKSRRAGPANPARDQVEPQ